MLLNCILGSTIQVAPVTLQQGTTPGYLQEDDCCLYLGEEPAEWPRS